MPQLLLHIGTTCYNFNPILQNAPKRFKIPKIEQYYSCYRGITCIYIWSVWNILECFMFFDFFVMCYIIFHFDAKRVYIWLYLESVKYSGMLYVFCFFCHVLHNFPFWCKTCIYLIISGICEIFWNALCFLFFCHVLHNFSFWGKTCIYLIISRICEIFWNALCFLIFFVMFYLIFHFEAKRVYIWLFLESVKYSGMLYVFLSCVT